MAEPWLMYIGTCRLRARIHAEWLNIKNPKNSHDESALRQPAEENSVVNNEVKSDGVVRTMFKNQSN